ncbi:MAG: aromatic ring-hydroxylating dioxygenase subunit alpha [bacterium]|nr:aromatic ring-hydroxylating dioxygenase subunit alpha [Gammaproteobacteria bacterium]HIL95010.1 aromatic ring-hydroxylating dioxygenase subunit alpha [Pseudomonadales bacterium]
MSLEKIPVIDTKATLRVRQPLEKAWTLPPEAYTSADIFKAETDAVFKKDWICVARQEQVAEPGDFVCFDLPGQPLVIVRDRSGELQALSRICLHRAMPLVEDSGNTNRFTCPYHSWTYELDGSLRSAPLMDGVEDFDPKKCQLPQFQLEVWQGFIFVNQNEDARPLAPQLAKFSRLIQNYDLDKLEVFHTLDFPSPYNWKILTENFVEAYHHIGIHRNTFQPVYPAKDSFAEDNEGKPWVMLRMPGLHDENGTNVFPKLDDIQKDELFAACVFPTLLFAASASGAFWYQLEPYSNDQMNLKIHALGYPEVVQALDDESRAGLEAAVSMIHHEDIEANEGVWKGMHGSTTQQGRLSILEKPIWQLNQLWLDRMGG